MKIINFIILSLSFHIILILKRFIYNESIFFYDALLILFLFTLFLIIQNIYGIISKKINFSSNLKIALSIFFFNYSIIITLPALSNRSISIFLLNSINNEQLFENKKDSIIFDYLDKTKPINKRIKEQIIIGNIEKSNNKYVITSRGKVSVNIMNFIKKLYSVD